MSSPHRLPPCDHDECRGMTCDRAELAVLRSAVKEYDAAETAWEAWIDNPPIPCNEDGEV